MFYIVLSLVVCHVFACLWVFLSLLVSEDEATWMDGDIAKMEQSE